MASGNKRKWKLKPNIPKEYPKGTGKNCQEKNKYANKNEALNVASHMAGKYNTEYLRPYPCECGGWHLTSSKK